MSESKVFLFDDADPEMQQAYQNARANFRYFWRELAWERRRIVPALGLACVKAPFSDGEDAAPSDDHPSVEQMWLSEIEFDGEYIRGVLLNSPNWVTSVKEGDSARLTLDEITDWMYAINGEVFGAYTVNLMRARMSGRERKEHDDAWGLNFGDPRTIRVAPEPDSGGGFLKRWFGKPAPKSDEHPLSEAMAASLKENLKENPAMRDETDDRGWTLLHHQALAGSAATVKVLLECGAYANAESYGGKTPLQLAKALGWDKVVALLKGGGAR